MRRAALSILIPLMGPLVATLTAGCSPPERIAGREAVAPRRAVLLPPGREPGAPRVPWSQKTREQRIEYMGLVVFPEMKALFQKHDAEGFRQFRCQTCHGEDMVKVQYAMPNGLMALPAEDPVAAGKSIDEETARFMVDAVVPALHRLLERDPGAPVAAGCASCHAKE